MKLKELPDTVVHVPTQAEYDELMQMYEDAGWMWSGGDLPTASDYRWQVYKEETGVKAEDCLTYESIFFYKEDGYKVITLNEFKKEQGIMSNVVQTIQIELPDNHQKDELIECIKFLRELSRNYPQHLDIAYEALQREYNLPLLTEMQKAEL